jgi:hypothetical protein
MANTIHAGKDNPAATVALLVQRDGERPQIMLVAGEDFTIGSGEQCDLRLIDDALPKLHSILHVQGQVVWIEAADDDALISLGGEVFRRRALRDGDLLTFGRTEVTIHIGDAALRSLRQQSKTPRMDDDVSLLSAEELCDRIEREEKLVDEFDRRRRFGWQALMAAVREALNDEAGVPAAQPPSPAIAPLVNDDALEDLVAQVRDLSETLDERTKTLTAQEAQLIESSSQLCEAQLRVSRQLEQLLERLSRDDDRGELRVSA